MTSTCSQPAVHEAILDAVVRGESSTDDALRAHLESCSACRLARERLLRVSDCWQADNPTEVEIAAARRVARLRERPLRDGVWFARFAWAFAGAITAFGAVAAARRLTPPPELAAAPTRECLPSAAAPGTAAVGAAQPLPPGTDHYVERDGARSELVQATRIDLAAGERATVMTGAAVPLNLEGPCLVEMRTDATQPGGWRAVYLEGRPPEPDSAPKSAASQPKATATPVPTPASSEAPSTPAAPNAAEGWTRASDAMKRGDFAGADRAFSDLNVSRDPATRDASRLARAELWIANGRKNEMRPMLSDLAANGSTELIRKRAAALLSAEP